MLPKTNSKLKYHYNKPTKYHNMIAGHIEKVSFIADIKNTINIDFHDGCSLTDNADN